MIRSSLAGEPATNACTGSRELGCCDAISTEERGAGALFSRDAVSWPRYQISSIESSMWSPSPDGNHWWGSAVSQGRVPVCQMATLSIGSAQTSSRVCPVQPSSQGRFAGSWSRLPLEFPAPGAERGWLGAPFPSDPSTSSRLPLVPLDRDGREPGCDPWFCFNISYFWPSSILMAHSDVMGSTRKDVATSR